MDALTLTAVSTVALTCLLPVYGYVTYRYYRRWHGNPTIRYFGATVALLASIFLAGCGIEFVCLCTLAARYFEVTVLPPGVGLLIIVIAFFAPAPSMVWLLRLLTGERPA